MGLKKNNIIKNVIFDLDNTLYDEKIFITKFFLYLKKKHKFKLSYIDFFFKNDIYKKKDFIKFILIKEKKYTKKFHNKIFYEFRNFKYTIKPFNDLKKILLLLIKKKIKLTILTNGNVEIQKKKIHNLNLKKYFNYIFFARKVYKDKPSITTFKIVLNKIKAKNSETLMIGDDYYTDIIGAKKAGLRTLLLYNTFKIYYNKKNIDYKTKSLKSLFLILNKIIT